jgi:hypothetical protein
MSTAYCYHCKQYHQIEQMRLLVTKTGKRWRCIRSIEATRVSREARDNFGKQISANNRADNEHRARLFSQAKD